MFSLPLSACNWRLERLKAREEGVYIGTHNYLLRVSAKRLGTAISLVRSSAFWLLPELIRVVDDGVVPLFSQREPAGFRLDSTSYASQLVVETRQTETRRKRDKLRVPLAQTFTEFRSTGQTIHMVLLDLTSSRFTRLEKPFSVVFAPKFVACCAALAIDDAVVQRLGGRFSAEVFNRLVCYLASPGLAGIEAVDFRILLRMISMPDTQSLIGVAS